MSKDDKLRSPGQTITDLARDGRLDERIDERLVVARDGISDTLKPHIDDAAQLVIETLDQHLTSMDDSIKESKSDVRFRFWVGLSIGLSLLVGFVAGLLMRGIL